VDIGFVIVFDKSTDEGEADLGIAVLDIAVEAAQGVPVGDGEFLIAGHQGGPEPACRTRPPVPPPSKSSLRVSTSRLLPKRRGRESK